MHPTSSWTSRSTLTAAACLLASSVLGGCWFLCGFYGGGFAVVFVLLLTFVFVSDTHIELTMSQTLSLVYYIGIHSLSPQEKEKTMTLPIFR